MKGISDQQIKEFDTNGVVFLENYFSEEWIEKLKEGFDTLNQLPEWYIYALLAAIASSFGLKVTDLAIKKFKK